MKLERITPRVSKTYLILVAAIVWTFAGSMLEFRGYSFLMINPHFLLIKIMASLIAGLLFFRLLFLKISGKHVKRIENLPIERPCLFSFFNGRSYLLMGIMISSGIILRKSGAASPEILALIYLTMGVPLLLSSIRFYKTFFSRN